MFQHCNVVFSSRVIVARISIHIYTRVVSTMFDLSPGCVVNLVRLGGCKQKNYVIMNNRIKYIYYICLPSKHTLFLSGFWKIPLDVSSVYSNSWTRSEKACPSSHNFCLAKNLGYNTIHPFCCKCLANLQNWICSWLYTTNTIYSAGETESYFGGSKNLSFKIVWISDPVFNIVFQFIFCGWFWYFVGT